MRERNAFIDLANTENMSWHDLAQAMRSWINRAMLAEAENIKLWRVIKAANKWAETDCWSGPEFDEFMEALDTLDGDQS